MVAVVARFIVGLIGLTSCFTAASEVASDSRRVVETLGSPASFRGSSSNLERSSAALENINGAAETEASSALPSDALPSDALQEASAKTTLMLNLDVVGSAHRGSQEVPTSVETNAVGHQQAPIVTFSGKLVRNMSFMSDTCKNSFRAMGNDAKTSMRTHLRTNTAHYIDKSRDQICKDNTTVSGSNIGNVIKGTYSQSCACSEAWRSRYGRSPSEFFIELLETRCDYSEYECKVWECTQESVCGFLGRLRVECPFRIVYL